MDFIKGFKNIMAETIEIIEEDNGNDHESYSLETPVRADAFLMSDEEKIKKISGHFREIMQTLGLDLKDDSLKETPQRVAKMYVKEAFKGLNPAGKPVSKLFENKYRYNEMLIEKNITLYTYCEHHFVSIIGKVHVAYISNGFVIGLSKINRLVQYYASRPQVQERLTNQIAEGLRDALNSEDVAVIIDAEHMCVSSRGIKDTNSSTITTSYSGRFMNDNTKDEFLKLINLSA